MSFKINASMFIKPHDLPPSAWTGHIPFAAWVIEELEPRVFVELGTHTGTSYLAFCQAVQENRLSTKCHAVDTWRGTNTPDAMEMRSTRRFASPTTSAMPACRSSCE